MTVIFFTSLFYSIFYTIKMVNLKKRIIQLQNKINQEKKHEFTNLSSQVKKSITIVK